MIKFGFKEITAVNIIEPDPVLRGFVKLLPNGRSEPLTVEDYLKLIYIPSLIDTVPIEVQALFEVARGAMVYGYFFYPLFTLAMEQLFRVAEAAVTHKCTAMGAPESIKKFYKKSDWLIDKAIIPKADKGLWDAIRELRNLASHPERPMALTPAMVIESLDSVAWRINSLFNAEPI